MIEDPNELLEVSRDELRTVVGGSPKLRIGLLFSRPLQDHFDVRLFHFLTKFPVHDASRAAVQHATHEEKRTAYVQITDVDMPVFVRLRGLSKAGSLFGFLVIETIHHSGFTEHAVNAQWTDRDDVTVKHHERQSSVSFERIGVIEIEDRLLLTVFRSEVLRNGTVVLVDFAVAFFLVKELALHDPDPLNNLLDRCLGTFGPVVGVVSNRVSRVVGQ